jgi:hypothetical protein
MQNTSPLVSASIEEPKERLLSASVDNQETISRGISNGGIFGKGDK